MFTIIMCYNAQFHHVFSLILCLNQLLKHIETTSPECVLYPEQVGLCEPVPVKCGGVMDEEGVGAVEGGMVRLLMQQDFNEKQYIKEAFSQSRCVRMTLCVCVCVWYLYYEL